MVLVMIRSRMKLRVTKVIKIHEGVYLALSSVWRGMVAKFHKLISAFIYNTISSINNI